MDEIVFMNILKNIFLSTGIIGILFGLDLIFGARLLLALKWVLDRMTDIDKKILSNSRSTRLFGVVILILSLMIVFIITQIKLQG